MQRLSAALLGDAWGVEPPSSENSSLESTQADHQANPGTLELPLVFTKPGQYSLCADAALPPLSFETAVCTDKFNVRP